MEWWGVIVAMASLMTWCSFRQEAREKKTFAEHFRQHQASRPVIAAEEFSRQCGADVSPDIANRVRRILAEVGVTWILPSDAADAFHSDGIYADDHLEADLGYHLDSLAFIELEARLEDEFGVRLVAIEHDGPVTVRDIVLVVKRSLNI
ncbi:MAG: acyl carrier protein [Planctomycetota bacterium]|nr:acyl carrier protein [Planctomycetota bacterium]MDA1211372.1 acyl carrier protein [Planctomycetota bacterium]